MISKGSIMFYSMQIDSNGFIISKGIHFNNPPLQADVGQGVTLYVANTPYSFDTSMRLSLQDGGFYKVDQHGNNIPETFIPFEG